MSDHNKLDVLMAESSVPPMVLQMLIDEIKQARISQHEFQAESRAEFRRIHDKMDELRDGVRKDLQGHDRDIVKLTTEAEIAGRRSGFIAGAAASLAIYALIALFTWGLDQVRLVTGG